MALSTKEIELLIKKLRDRYREYGAKHSRAWFNLESFDQRHAMAVDKGMNMEAFALAEIANFEKTREKYEKKKSEKPFSKLVDDIMEQNAERVRKYPAVYFHPNADLEIVHFYGAMQDFALHRLPILRILLDEANQIDGLNRLEDALSILAIPTGRKHSRRILDHIMVLSRTTTSGSLEAEKDRNNYLKESAFLLHDIVDFCDELLTRRRQEWEMPIRFDRLRIEGQNKRKLTADFSSLTGYGAVLEVKNTAENIIQDFRLSAFRRKQSNSF
ncbi:MAG: hypothetical protein EHM32_03100 [Spirochaetales bacterium]|nr:MAG: hypothetical protein EHM32_03100 [Spirochaetales bacterium]